MTKSASEVPLGKVSFILQSRIVERIEDQKFMNAYGIAASMEELHPNNVITQLRLHLQLAATAIIQLCRSPANLSIKTHPTALYTSSQSVGPPSFQAQLKSQTCKYQTLFA